VIVDREAGVVLVIKFDINYWSIGKTVHDF